MKIYFCDHECIIHFKSDSITQISILAKTDFGEGLTILGRCHESQPREAKRRS